ncbi:hypothetical protein CT138_04280 [Mannheimia varigena]|uniref:hypothetical protein n=1 Tax=Mannheimia varigena TaxID=85404 RepID=UPI000DBEFEE9|nr:hypothetical protein [Mannheimia varigena]AWW34113.1 hypothetical protein CT138_04280 [Mannheimia varigena]
MKQRNDRPLFEKEGIRGEILQAVDLAEFFADLTACPFYSPSGGSGERSEPKEEFPLAPASQGTSPIGGKKYIPK